MKIKTKIKFTPLVLAGLLSTSFACSKKDNEVMNNTREVDSSNINYVVEETVEIENISMNDNTIELEEESIDNLELSYIVTANINTKIYTNKDKSEKIGMLIKGESLRLLNVYEGWCEVEYDGASAYLSIEDVEIVECYGTYYEKNIPIIKTKDDFKNEFEEIDVVVATSRVNVRLEATTESEKLDQLKVGESLPLINVYDKWCEVNYYGRSAYVYREYVNVSKEYYPKYEMKDMVYMTSNTPLIDINTEETLFTIPKREVAEVYAQNDEYYLVKCNGRVGYVSKKHSCSLGDKYVIIDISSQNLKVYVDDKLVVDTPIVTGKDSTPTYCGLFDVRTKEENVHWPEFKVTVKYWMPFNRGEGMHDANWRKKFGGEIFHKDGSHGCVNIPPEVMPYVFEYVDVKTPVLVKK